MGNEQRERETMDISTPVGGFVTYTLWTNGGKADRELADSYLTRGKRYRVAGIDVHNWSSTVRFGGLGIWFNTVLFENESEVSDAEV